MNKRDYLDELESGLDCIPAAERREIVMELESHIDEALGVRSDLSEEDVVSRLPPPASVAARYRSEAEPEFEDAGRGGPAHRSRSASGSEGGLEGEFPFGDPDDFFRFARREPETVEGETDGVERLEIRSVSADIVLSPGLSLRYRIKGSWGPGDEPKLRSEGSRLFMDLGRHCRRAEIEIPPSLVELIATSASGDVMAELPQGVAVSLKMASGDAHIISANGLVAASSASGDIRVEGRPDEARIRTSSGDVDIGPVDVATVSSDSGDISISLSNPGSEATVATLSGDVSIRLAQGAKPSIVVETLSGDVSIPDAQKTSSRGRKRWECAGGPGMIATKTLSGDVSIH